MKKLTAVATMVPIAVPALTAPSTVQAGDSGAVAAGVAGGLLVAEMATRLADARFRG
jgi:hypothetical protein